MEAADLVVQLGGMATHQQLRSCLSREQLRQALQDGELVRVDRSHYALPTTDLALRTATRLKGVIAGPSAAVLHGFSLKSKPTKPWVLVDRHHQVRKPGDARVLWGDPTEDERSNLLTSPLRTVLESARWLAFDEAVCIADSALRMGVVDAEELRAAAERLPRTGRAKAIRVAEFADGRAANAFESVLRCIASRVPGLDVEPQVWIGDIGRPDLVSVRKRIIIEADSYEFHGDRIGFRRDIERYNAFTLQGWLVLRFAWAHVMHHPDYVEECLRAAVLLAA